MTQGVDFAFSHPDPHGLYDLGFRFAGRYIGAGTDDKQLHADEIAALNGAGLAIVSLVEGGSRGALSGYLTGVTQGQLALDDVNQLGIPADRPMYAAIDWDFHAGDMAAVGQYLDGLASVIGRERVGVYGGYQAVRWAREQWGARWLFQTYAWSAGQWYPAAQLRQTLNGQEAAGGTVDLCLATVDDYGQWMIGGSVMSEWTLTPDGDKPWALTQGAEGYVGQQRDTALAFAWKNATDAFATASRIEAMLTATADQPSMAEIRSAVNALADVVGQLVGKVGQLVDRPLVDAVAVAEAIRARPEIAAAIASDVAGQLGTLTGSLYLSGTLSGRVGGS